VLNKEKTLQLSCNSSAFFIRLFKCLYFEEDYAPCGRMILSGVLNKEKALVLRTKAFSL
jgi:hypothetical protein